jgi:hypothetical protein
MLREPGVLSARLAGAALHVQARDGRRALHALRRLSQGGFNTVYVADGLVVRLSSRPLAPEEQRNYYREIGVQRALAAKGLSPEPLAVLHLVPPARCSYEERPYARAARIGLCMVRFDCTLDAVLASAELTARVFIEHAGADALVELFARAAAIATCVDTKAANVVVRLRPAVSFALIDVDVYFCGIAERPEAAAGGVAWLDAALGAGAPDRAAGLAALSLLLLCLDAAAVSPAMQLGPIVRVLRRHALALMRLVADDEIATRAPAARAEAAWMGARVSLLEQLAHYTEVRRVGDIAVELEAAAAETPQSRLLALCSSPPDPALYVRASALAPRALAAEIQRLARRAPQA